MTIKITALLTSVSAVALYIISLQVPNDPYFFFISSNTIVGILRLLLAAGLINIAFQSQFVYKYSHYGLAIVGALLIAFGLAGLAVPALDYALFNYVKPMDFMYSMLIGTSFAYAAASYGRGTERLPRLYRPRHNQLRLLTKRAA